MASSDFTWHYVFNQFANSTIKNFKLMNMLSSSHNSYLYSYAQSGKELFVELYESFNLQRKEYNSTYVNWLVAKGIYKAQTVRLMNCLNELINEKIPRWDAQVQAVYLEKTPEYIEIFPGGRTAFQRGPYDIRISQLHSLSSSVSKSEKLNKTAKDVKSFYNKLNDIRINQLGNKSGVINTSSQLEHSRISIATAMYYNLGRLMSYYKDEPKQIQNFFKLEYITNKYKIKDDEPEVVAEGKIEPDSKITIDALTGKFKADTELVIHNTGDVAIEIYTTHLPDDPVPGTTLSIEPDKIAVTKCSELGAEENLYLMINNASAEKTASYSVGVNHYGLNKEEIK